MTALIPRLRRQARLAREEYPLPAATASDRQERLYHFPLIIAQFTSRHLSVLPARREPGSESDRIDHDSRQALSAYCPLVPAGRSRMTSGNSPPHVLSLLPDRATPADRRMSRIAS
jgi:hypothetical protein